MRRSETKILTSHVGSVPFLMPLDKAAADYGTRLTLAVDAVVDKQRVARFAKRVGKANVIAGADCGLGGRSHPQIARAKLKALVDGARLASQQLW